MKTKMQEQVSARHDLDVWIAGRWQQEIQKGTAANLETEIVTMNKETKVTLSKKMMITLKNAK